MNNSISFPSSFTLLLFLISFTPHTFSQTYQPGTSYTDSTNFIEFIAGNIPIIISAPHGGYLEPDSIPDCPNCSTVRDAYTQEIARGISDTYFARTGCYPHVIINLLHRRKLDANRDMEDATGGVLILEDAWSAYHAFIDSAKAQITQDYGKGLFLDLHGHGHDIQRIEMGYLLSKSELQMTDDEINSAAIISESSIQALVNSNLQSLTHAELLRGEFSFGTIMNDKGFPAVPSQTDPFPQNDEPYFTGGYNTRRHGTINGGHMDAIQFEFNQSIRFDDDIREMLIDSLVSAIIDYVDFHYVSDFSIDQCDVLSNISIVDFSSNIRVFPNPSSEFIYIEGLNKNVEVRIYDILGREVFRQKWMGQPLEIKELNHGNYFLKIRDEDVVKTATLIIMK